MGDASDTEQLALETATPQTNKRKRKKSPVWEHFTVEDVGGGTSRACCKLCNQTFAYSSGSKIAGTSHLKRHITLGSCPKIKEKQLALTGGEATEPTRRRHRINFSALFDQETSFENLAKMIILHEYPLLMVEQPAVVIFAQSLQPRFKMPSANEVYGAILAIYHKEKQNLMQSFKTLTGGINLTVSLWTTSQSLGYVCLKAQFIDGDWKFHRRMLNFMMVSSAHSENALSEVIGVTLSEWNMKNKLFAVTLDNNCESHEIYSANLRDLLSNKNMLLLKGQLFVVRCYAHTLNVIAQDVLASIHGIIYHIRESVKFVRVSPAREDKFAEIALQLEIPSTKSLSLDIATQWNTTYHMLTAALEYKEAFATLNAHDELYNEAPTAEDWKKLEIVCSYLKILYDSANVVMTTEQPTANIFFQEAWKIQLELASGVLNEDEVVKSIAKEMHEKFDSYWRDCSLILAIAVVMDPRFKMKLVDFSFSKLYGEDAAKYVKMVNDSIHELYNEYANQPLALTYSEQPGEEESDIIGEAHNGINDIDIVQPAVTSPTPTSGGIGLIDFDMYISEMGVNHSSKSELEQYFEETLVPRFQEFDILNWWKLNTIRYPTLSRMAKDVLAIPMSMVDTGSSFFSTGTGSRTLDDYRSTLRSEIVEALFCAKDWLQHTHTIMEPSSNALVKIDV